MNVIKLHNLSRWLSLPADNAIEFCEVSPGSRLIRLYLNVANAGTLAIVRDKAAPEFLAAVEPGLNLLEFHAAGAFKVLADAECGSVRYFTSEAECGHVVVNDPEIFTGIARRRERNPEMERLMFMMRQTIDARLAQQAAAFNEQLAKAKGNSDGDGRKTEKVDGDLRMAEGVEKSRKPAEAKRPAVHEPAPAKPAKPRLDASGPDKGAPEKPGEADDAAGEVADG